MNRLFAVLFVVQLAASANAGSPLADAIERSDRGQVLVLLDRGEDVNAAQPDGMTALHWAAYHDDVATAKRLIASGARANARNRYGVTPLSLACTNGNGELVALLLEAGADPNSSLPGGETALMTAARTGRLAAVRALLEAGADVNAKERRGQTAIMWAAADGHASVVEALLEAGAEFREPLPGGFTPFFFAVREGHADVVAVLLVAGADINESMQVKRRTGPRSAESGMTALILAIENGHFELAVSLLDAGADPNEGRAGFTPLHTLAWVRKPNRGDGADGDPPPIGSGSLGSLDFARELVRRGADVNARLEKPGRRFGGISRGGATPFLYAARTADAAFMRTLIELGADPKLTNDENCTALLAAAGVGTGAPGEEAGTEPEVLEAVAFALELGLDVNAVDDNGETAMHGAAYKNYPQVVAFLAAHGAEIETWNRKNKRGWTPLLIAQGYRPGNFRPSADTIAAIESVMRTTGIEPSPPPTAQKGYEP